MARLEDVARIAGVSAATVSRAISRPELVNDATRERVERAIAQLGYRPSRVARRLRAESRGSSLIGLIIPDIQNPFFADLVRGVEDVALEHGYVVFLGNSDEDAVKEKRYLDVMRAESVGGVILPPSSGGAAAALDLAGTGIPVVCVDRRLPRDALDTVVLDNARGARDAVEHLIGLGHRRIGFLEGRPGLSTSHERLDGYRSALRHHGIPAEPALVRQGDSRLESGRRLADQLLGVPDPPTALVAGNNLMTLGALQTIRRRRLDIPHDIALVGYDDMPWALALDPPLTVVRQPGDEMGRRAMQLLLERIHHPERSTTVVTLQPRLVVRGSCGAPPG